MIVMKFGGTSNADAAAMRNVIRIVKEHLPEHPVVVISAVAKATNELERIARTAQTGDEAAALALIGTLFARHAQILADLIQDPARTEQLQVKFAQYRTALETMVKGIAILRELTLRSQDAVCAFGERLSSSLVAAGLQEAGVDAVWLDTKDFMITDDNFGAAQPLMNEVAKRLQQIALPLIERGTVPVTQGFIGVTTGGAPTTMGRESSDFSASIIGAAMGAACVQIWTDVDGILTGDPSVVEGAQLIDRMTFQEAFELAYFGAKVLHPGTMIPMFEKEIPIRIRNSKNTASPGTLVSNEKIEAESSVVKSIASKRGVRLLRVRPERRVNQYLFWDGVYNILHQHGIGVRSAATSEYGLAVTIDANVDMAGVLRELKDVGIVEMTEGLAAVCLVGEGIRTARNVLPRVFAALGEMEVPFISAGASDVSIALAVHEDEMEDAIRRLHGEFFEEELEVPWKS